MTIEDILAFVVADESRTLELKKSTGVLKDGVHAACTFLNNEESWLSRHSVAYTSRRYIKNNTAGKL